LNGRTASLPKHAWLGGAKQVNLVVQKQSTLFLMLLDAFLWKEEMMA